MKQAALIFVVMISACFSFGQTLNLFFDVNKYELTDEHKVQIDNILGGKVIMCIKGYADTTGTKAYNKTLSRKRADEVFKYLKKKIINLKLPEYLGEQHRSEERRVGKE